MSNKKHRGFRRGFSLLDAAGGMFILGWVVLIFVAAYPSSHRAARAVADETQVISIAQHKIDQLRAVGFGRLTYTELKNAGIIQSSPTTAPYRFETADSLTGLWSPVGTINCYTTTDPKVTRVVVHIDWQQTSGGTRKSYDVETLVAQD
jgi:hypothetical protein